MLVITKRRKKIYKLIFQESKTELGKIKKGKISGEGGYGRNMKKTKQRKNKIHYPENQKTYENKKGNKRKD